MKACNLTMTYDALREKLGLPDTVRITFIGNYANIYEEAMFTLEGIGPDVKPGQALTNVAGVLRLETDKGLSWEIT